jgi:hypothetical protein
MKFDKIKKYSRSSKHIDEKLQFLNSKLQQTNMLSEIPTNNTSGIYVVEPEYIRTDIGEPEVPVDLTLNGQSGRDTSGIFDYGISLMQDPPGDASYFLGPIVSIYDSDTNSTQIGYVRESDRHMVNLGRVAGTLDAWDGSSGFTSYGQLTAEQVSWYKTQYSSNKVADYPVFYTGLSRTQNNLLQTFDNFGRVVAQILNLPKQSYQIPNSKQFSSPVPPGGLNWRAIGGEPSNFNVFYYDANYPQQQTDYLIQRGQINNFNSYLNGSNGPGSAINEPANSVQVNRLTGDDSGYVEVRINGKLSLRWLNIYNASDPMSDWIVAIDNLTNINSSPMTVQGTRNVTNTRVPPVMGPFDKNVLPGSALPKNSGALDLLRNIIGFGNKVKELFSKNYSKLPISTPFGIFSRDQIIAGLKVASLVMKVPTAFNVMTTYNNFLGNNGKGAGSSLKNPIDLSNQLSTKDMNALIKATNDPSVKSAIKQAANSDINKSYTDPITKQPTTIGQYYSDQIMQKVNQAIYSNLGLSNTLHNNVQVDMQKTLQTGNVVLTKAYVFRSGGSISDFEKSLPGQLLSSAGVPLDLFGQSKNPLVYYGAPIAAAVGLTNMWVNYGGPYKSPPMYYQITVPNTPIKEECEYSDNRKRILKEVKKPYVLPEQKKVKITRRPRVIGSSMMKDPKIEQPFKQREENIWGRKEYQQNVRLSQGRMNEVLDRVGTGDHAWEFISDRNRQKGKEIAYNNFNVNTDKVKGKVVHKEEIRGDKILIVEDPETHKKSNILQSELNELLEKQFGHIVEEPKEDDYTNSLYRKSLKKLGYNFEYDDKPSSKGYPNNPPPEMVNGWHPEYGKRDAMYNRMDPKSAEVMQRVKKLEKVKAVVKKTKETP